jgi:exosortase/archaeosortase family protein
MEKEVVSNKKLILIVLRYIILLVLVLNSYLIYKIFTPLTIYFSVIFLKLFYPVLFFGEQILINQTKIIEIIPSCVAGSAYVLLLILNLFVAMKPKQRIYSILLSFSLLFIFNILRIIVLSILLVNDFEFFYITHKLVWYVLSTILVVGIWFLTIKIFKIKEMPIISDIKCFIKSIRESKNK